MRADDGSSPSRVCESAASHGRVESALDQSDRVPRDDLMVASDDMPDLENPHAGDPVFDLHVGGKMEIASRRSPLNGPDELSLAYTPGVARVCEAIAADPALTPATTPGCPTPSAIVTDGTAVLGLGDIGPAAAMPVMEGKAVLFKQFGGVDAVPICLDTTDVDEIVETVVRLAPSFGGINLEDISAPRCFEIEERLKQRLDIPVFHDDQHGTAVVALAALENALRLTGRDRRRPRAWSISGAGAAGVAVARILLAAGHHATSRCSTARGVLTSAARATSTTVQARPSPRTPPTLTGRTGTPGRRDGRRRRLHRRLRRHRARGGRRDDGATTRSSSAWPTRNPEVHPDVAHRHARVVATGRSDFPNQINNVLAFPGIFRGAFDVRATAITEGMKLAAADALAGARRRRPRRGPDHPVAVRPPVGRRCRRSPTAVAGEARPVAGTGVGARAVVERVGSRR